MAYSSLGGMGNRVAKCFVRRYKRASPSRSYISIKIARRGVIHGQSRN